MHAPFPTWSLRSTPQFEKRPAFYAINLRFFFVRKSIHRRDKRSFSKIIYFSGFDFLKNVYELFERNMHGNTDRCAYLIS